MAEKERKSPEDVRRHLRGLNPRRPEDEARLHRWRAAKRITWIALLAVAILIYYLLDQLLEALKLPGSFR